MKNNIVLIGFMGSGKTSVGKRLAGKIKYKFIDTDEWIEKTEKMKISEIFEKHGEEYFRNLETNTIKELISSTKSTIISTGGGMPLRECNARLLKELGVVIYLKASEEITIKRVKGDTTRPLLAGDNLEERVNRLLTERMPVYEAAAHKKIITDNISFELIIEEIMKYYSEAAFFSGASGN